jgi:hypothetical protein
MLAEGCPIVDVSLDAVTMPKTKSLAALRIATFQNFSVERHAPINV